MDHNAVPCVIIPPAYYTTSWSERSTKEGIKESSCCNLWQYAHTSLCTNKLKHPYCKNKRNMFLSGGGLFRFLGMFNWFSHNILFDPVKQRLVPSPHVFRFWQSSYIAWQLSHQTWTKITIFHSVVVVFFTLTNVVSRRLSEHFLLFQTSLSLTNIQTLSLCVCQPVSLFRGSIGSCWVLIKAQIKSAAV